MRVVREKEALREEGSAQEGSGPVPTVTERDRELEVLLCQVEEETAGLAEEVQRKEFLETLRSYYHRESERIWQLHQGGAPARAVIEERSDLMDTIIRQLYNRYLLGLPGATEGGEREGTILALGGYGRRELHPCSDVDLMFLYRRDLHPHFGLLVERILYALWDMGLMVGHSCRSLRECIRMARRDLTVKTSLLEARYLAGDRQLFQSFAARLEREVIGDKVSQFLRQKVEELEARYQKYGSSLYVQEPNVKESMGGLRDLHTALWMARARFRTSSLAELEQLSVIAAEEARRAEETLDFMWRLRNDLHYLYGQKNDVLSLAVQRQVAERLGYRDQGGKFGVEELMRHYFLHAKFLHRLAQKIIYRSLVHTSGVKEIMARLRAREMGDGLVEMRGKIGIWPQDRERFARDPLNLFRVFLRALRGGYSLTQDMQDLIHSQVESLGEEFRRSAGAGELFLSLLREGPGLARVLRTMHECGLLGAYLPEFSRLTCLVQYDFYHKYTVDEHTFVAFDHLERLLSSPPPDLEELHRIARELERPELFKLALLLHDVGKAEGKDHVSKGSRIVSSLLSRLPLDQEERELVLFLVSNHLTMAHIAERRDLDDGRVIIDFAKKVRDLNRLKMLYLHTYLDIKAVSPVAWTEWKAALLWELYLKTHALLARGLPEQEEDLARAREVRERFLSEWDQEMGSTFIADHLDRMPTRYLLATAPEKIATHLRLCRELDGRSVVTHVQHFPRIGYSELTVCTRSHPGLFSDLVGVLSAHRLNILSAQIYTRSDGLAFDTFQVNTLQGMAVTNHYLWEKVQKELEAVLRGELAVEDLIAAHRREHRERMGKKVLALPPRVEFDNYISDSHTVIDIRAADRLGLLYLICQTLSFLGLDIGYAKITTEVDQAMDVFYVTDREGRKVVDEERLSWIRRTLEGVLSRETGGT
jgi:[protein-PII] uridylyltransferase